MSTFVLVHGAWAWKKVVPLDTDHSPFLSRPARLARHLVSFAVPHEAGVRTPGRRELEEKL